MHVLFANTFTTSLLSVVGISLFAACTTGPVGTSAGPPPIGDPNPGGKAPGDMCTDGDECRTAICLTDANCASGVCIDFRCGDKPSDGCGGPAGLVRCADGKPCSVGNDCESGLCEGATCAPREAKDGVQNGGETDIDCGGPRFRKCEDGKGCQNGADCQSKVCGETNTCAPSSYEDKIKNGAETDVDCGGPGAPKKCAAGLRCNEHSDCESNGCAHDKTCAMGATCTELEGGQTCGPNDGLGKQADCCDRAKVGPYTVGKYLITAGRMRAFLARHDGKIRDWASTLPADRWDQAWTAKLPNSIDGEPGDGNNANTQLGPHFGKRSCETGYHTGHTFWTPSAYGDTKDFPRSVLDTKALNCVPWWLMKALCVFDGGHLLTAAELHAAYTNASTTSYPWGARGTYTTSSSNDHAVQLWSYATPNPPKGAARDQAGYKDVAFYIAPPGRRPAGKSAMGISDLVGNLLEWVGDSERQFVWKGSFENHAREADMIAAPIDDDPYLVMRTATTPWRWHDVVALGQDSENVNGYYAIGGRCGY